MKRHFMKIALGVLISGALITSCKKDEVEEPNEEEVITTLLVRLTPTGGGTTLQYAFDDPDGDGGAAPTYQEIILAPATTYNAELILLNKTANPVDTISNEVEEESEAHRFYFEPQGGANLTVSNLNTDANGIPVGLQSTWTTGAASTGKLQITLRHYGATPPNKGEGDLINDPKSSTDVTTADTGGFTVKIQ